MNLLEKKEFLFQTASLLFKKITSLPQDIRPDIKERTGIAVLVREIGTANIVYFTIENPSDAAKFFVSEKAIRSEILEDYASQNSENPDKLKFAGSITIEIDGKKFQFSCSGLKANEDVFIDITLACFLFGLKANVCINMVKDKGGKMPDFYSEELNYLVQLAM